MVKNLGFANDEMNCRGVNLHQSPLQVGQTLVSVEGPGRRDFSCFFGAKRDLEVSTVLGVPPRNGCFIRENPNPKWMIGVPPFSELETLIQQFLILDGQAKSESPVEGCGLKIPLFIGFQRCIPIQEIGLDIWVMLINSMVKACCSQNRTRLDPA